MVTVEIPEAWYKREVEATSRLERNLNSVKGSEMACWTAM
jgi:hypothetical protein